MRTLKLKECYLDNTITCPLSKKQEVVRFIDKRLYNLYHNKGFAWLFEEPVVEPELFINEKEIITENKNGVKKDDIS